jgi:hypothetical protein
VPAFIPNPLDKVVPFKRLSPIVFPTEDTPELKRVPIPLPSSDSPNISSDNLLDNKEVKAFIPVGATFLLKNYIVFY